MTTIPPRACWLIGGQSFIDRLSGSAAESRKRLRPLCTVQAHACAHNPQSPHGVGVQRTRSEKCPGFWDRHHLPSSLEATEWFLCGLPCSSSGFFFQAVCPWASCLTPLGLCEMRIFLFSTRWSYYEG